MSLSLIGRLPASHPRTSEWIFPSVEQDDDMPQRCTMGYHPSQWHHVRAHRAANANAGIAKWTLYTPSLDQMHIAPIPVSLHVLSSPLQPNGALAGTRACDTAGSLYGEPQWVGKQILAAAAFKAPLRPIVARIGPLCGAGGTGLSVSSTHQLCRQSSFQTYPCLSRVRVPISTSSCSPLRVRDAHDEHTRSAPPL